MKLLLPSDEMDFYLVQEGLKPAAIYSFSLKCDLQGKVVDPNEKRKAQLVYDEIRGFDFLFDYLLQQISKKRTVVTFLVGNSSRRLNRVCRAIQISGDSKLGLALGYPKDAVFSNPKSPVEIKNSRDYARAINMLEKAGLLPSYLKYLNHVPRGFELSNGNIRISQSSEKQARTYQEYIRKNNPNLAKRIEAA